MSQKIDEIILLEEKLKEESQSHLLQKANLSKELKALKAAEDEIKKKLIQLKTLDPHKQPSKKQGDLNNLKNQQENLQSSKNLLEREINTLEDQISDLKTQISQYTSEIAALGEIKKEKESNTLALKQKQAKNKRIGIKIKNTKERIRKLERQLNQQKETKNNLLKYSKAFESIQTVIDNYINISTEDPSATPADLPEDIKNQIIQSRNLFHDSLERFSSNNIIPFLIDAQKAYQIIVGVFIQLCDALPPDILNEKFSDQVFQLVGNGLSLNTKHLTAVESMLNKLEKGVEIAPLASFANEVREYFIENLTLFRIIF